MNHFTSLEYKRFGLLKMVPDMFSLLRVSEKILVAIIKKIRHSQYKNEFNFKKIPYSSL